MPHERQNKTRRKASADRRALPEEIITTNKMKRTMKHISSILTAIIMLLFASTVTAQEYTYTLGNDAAKTIEFYTSNSDVIIEGHDGDDIIIRNMDYEAPPERAQGLKALYNSAKDNTGIGLSVEEENGTVRIVSASRNNGDFRLMVPNKVRLLLEQVNWGGGDFELRDLQGEVEIKSKTSDMILKNVTGPIIANSTSGDLEITMSSLSQAGPTSISLVSGFIDITMPAASKANLYLSSISGEVYTDMDIQLRGDKEKSMQRIAGGRDIQGTLNGGGVEMRLKTISGDIYLRKK